MTGPGSHIALLRDMLSIPAFSREEEQRCDFLEQYLQGSGFNVRRRGNNLLVGESRENDHRPALLLNSHMDTVAPSGKWDSDPLKPQVEQDRIVGLGSNDAGASVVTLIGVYRDLHRELEDRMQLLLLISAEEEVSGQGGISSVLPHLVNVDGAIVGEPTGMQPAVAERGLMVLDGTVKGRPGHAARGEGVNAIYKAMEDLVSIRNLRFPEGSGWLPPASAQVTMISAGTVHNVVPGLCEYVVDVRSNDRCGNEEMLEMIRSVCHATLEPRSMRLKSSCIPDGHFLMEAIRRCGLTPFGSSTLSDMALLPFPAIKMGPGDSSRSHTAGEYILFDELKQGIEGYTRFLRSMKFSNS